MSLGHLGSRGELAGLPPTHIVTGECDPLREEDEAYAESLRAAGVQASITCYENMFHGFFNLSDHLPIARRATEDVCGVLRDALKGSPWN